MNGSPVPCQFQPQNFRSWVAAGPVRFNSHPVEAGHTQSGQRRVVLRIVSNVSAVSVSAARHQTARGPVEEICRGDVEGPGHAVL